MTSKKETNSSKVAKPCLLPVLTSSRLYRHLEPSAQQRSKYALTFAVCLAVDMCYRLLSPENMVIMSLELDRRNIIETPSA